MKNSSWAVAGLTSQLASHNLNRSASLAIAPLSLRSNTSFIFGNFEKMVSIGFDALDSGFMDYSETTCFIIERSSSLITVIERIEIPILFSLDIIYSLGK